MASHKDSNEVLEAHSANFPSFMFSVELKKKLNWFSDNVNADNVKTFGENIKA